jgi:hypothetical protein
MEMGSWKAWPLSIVLISEFQPIEPDSPRFVDVFHLEVSAINLLEMICD